MENTFKEKSLIGHSAGGYQIHPVPPGQLQNNVHRNTILGLVTSDKIPANVQNYTLDFHTPENLLRLTPYKDKGKNKWKLLFVIKNEQDGKICLKGALKNTETNTFALISSISESWWTDYSQPTVELTVTTSIEPVVAKTSKTTMSCDNNYKICLCKMIAPLLFWKELKNRVAVE